MRVRPAVKIRTMGEHYRFNPRTHESATKKPPESSPKKPVSIHALMRVRRKNFIVITTRTGFNPRTHESATRLVFLRFWPLPVSIHALMRVRRTANRNHKQKDSFNPRTHESATLPDEGGQSGEGNSFNPRTHESATPSTFGTRHAYIVSIHALMRVRLFLGSAWSVLSKVSIHALMRVRLRGGYGTDYQQCNGRFAPTSHGRYKDSRP